MASGPHDNIWAILTAIVVGLVGWGIVKVPGRWYISATKPAMYALWGVLLLWVLGSASKGIALRLRDATGFLFLFELMLGPIVAGIRRRRRGSIQRSTVEEHRSKLARPPFWTYPYIALIWVTVIGTAAASVYLARLGANRADIFGCAILQALALSYLYYSIRGGTVTLAGHAGTVFTQKDEPVRYMCVMALYLMGYLTIEWLGTVKAVRELLAATPKK